VKCTVLPSDRISSKLLLYLTSEAYSGSSLTCCAQAMLGQIHLEVQPRCRLSQVLNLLCLNEKHEVSNLENAILYLHIKDMDGQEGQMNMKSTDGLEDTGETYTRRF
jgi:hypothetical protein